jgi:hypothetical protein
VTTPLEPGSAEELLATVRDIVEEGDGDEVRVEIDVPNDEALALLHRLGFADARRELVADRAALQARLGDEQAPSSGAVHVQTDDQSAVEKAVTRFVPRVAPGSRSTVVGATENGCIAVYDEKAGGDPERLRRLASELSFVTGGVVVSLGVEGGAVVRLVAFDRGQMMDEYLSVPEYYGPLAPGDAIALRANPTLLSRLTGADPGAIRRVARTADSPAELPAADELRSQLAEALGIAGSDLGFDDASNRPGVVTVSHG